ncbi:hypothetical protein TNCV_4722541 [Trichonephila clavipes]|uniref:Uncharacterized protein n=1 Tax=Trichonephila clavipes TaxID=2585209 RepID=A0A8X6W7J7_TRICX|nr:hypothetical protein TNCV_4722541 [Trichonephila clavipes]
MAVGSLMVRALDSGPEGLVPCLNCGGGDRWWRAIYRNVLSSLREFHRAKIVLSPIWCSRLRPTTGVHLAHCHDEFRGPRSDYVRQRRLEQAEREAAHRAAEKPEQSQARCRRHAEYLATQRAAETPEQSQARRLTWRLREIQKPLKQLNLANALLLKGHNSDV